LSQVTRDQGHRPKRVGYLTGEVNADSFLKHLAFRENRARSANTRRVDLPVSIALKSDQALDKLGSGVVDVRN
jgi:hypothetical protein